MIIKQCEKCMALVNVIEEHGCDIMCCGEPMQELIPNSVDAAIEKHVPNYEVKGDMIEVTVNHVMEEEHYIAWIGMATNDSECIVHLKPSDEAKAEFKYVKGATLYAYCNKHSLWKKDVE